MFIHPNFDPVAVHIGPLSVRWYGLMYVIGFASGWLLGILRAKKPGSGWTTAMVEELISWCVVGLVVGARVGYVLFYDFGHFVEDPLSMLRIWEGGMSFHGGAAGIVAVCTLYGRKTGKGFFGVADFLVPLTPLALFAGRLGNFINGELWGKVTDLPWGVVFPDPRAGGLPRHPSQLYEGILEGLVLFVILWVFSSRPRPRGSVSGLFLVGYGVFRFLIEFVRLPDPQLGYLAFGWLTMGQILSLPMILIGLGFMAWAYRSKPGAARSQAA